MNTAAVRPVLPAILGALVLAGATPAAAQTPRIDRIEPNPIWPRIAVTVRVIGANFTLRSQVEWNGALVTPVTWVSATELQVRLAADAPMIAQPGTAFVRIYEQRCIEANQAFCGVYPDLYSNTVTVPIQTPPPSACGLFFTVSDSLNGPANSEFSRTISVAGGAPPYKITTLRDAEALLNKAGLQLTSPTDDTLQIYGTLPQAGKLQLPLSVRDFNGCVLHQAFEISVDTGLLLATSQLGDACVGQPYNQVLEAIGGTAPYRWYAMSGTLPPGLRIDRDKGTLSGTPAKPPGDEPLWTFYPRIQVDDSAFPSLSTDRVFALALNPALTMAPDRAEDATFGVAYAQTFVATGCKAPYRWELDPASLRFNGQVVTRAQLADQVGLAFSEDDAALRAEAPRQLGLLEFALVVVDAAGATSRKPFRLAIREPRLGITTSSLAEGTVGLAYSQKLSVQNGAAAYVWKATGSLPDGLTLPEAPQPTAEVELKGTPRKPGTFKFQVSVTDKDGFGTPGPKEFELRIKEALVGTPVARLVDASGKILPEVIEDPEGEVRVQLRVRNGYDKQPLAGTLSVEGFDLAAGVHADRDFASAYQLVRLAVAGSGRSIDFEVPAGGELAQFILPAAGGRPAARQDFVELQTGNVAGNIRLAVSRLAVTGIDVTPKAAAAARLSIPSLPPQVTRVCQALQSGAGLALRVTGYSTSRDPLEAELAIVADGIETGALTAPPDLDSRLLAWFENPESTNFGGSFAFQQVVPVSGSLTGVPSVSVTLRKKNSAEAFTGKLALSGGCEIR